MVGVCLGTACYVKGSQKVLDKLSEELKIPVGKTTEDGPSPERHPALARAAWPL